MIPFTFFAIVLGIVGGTYSYIFIRGLQAIPAGSSLRIPYIFAFWIVALSFFAGRILENYWHSFLSDIFIWVGSFWIAALVYFLLSIVLLDVLRLANHFLPFFPSFITSNYPAAKRILAIGVTGLVGLTLLAGYFNSTFPRIRTLHLSVDKKAGSLRHLNIVAASDIHLGSIIGRSRIAGIVDRINSLNPDVVLFPGDIVDEDLSDPGNDGLGEPLRKIRSRFGVFAATGNHEYLAGIKEASAFLTEHNITLLRDQAVEVADAFYIVSREDRSAPRYLGAPRKELGELMQGVDKSYPVIMMDHQPFGLKEASAQGVDLQLSGHTHDGQIWPINYIVGAIYELAWGYKKIGNTHYYVSDGAGTWGPPVRVGNRPEIVNIHLDFK